MSFDSLTVSEQESFISSQVNSTTLYVFLWGIYTVIYAGTSYLYLNKKSSRNNYILAAISLSYFAYSADVIMVWYLDQKAVVYDSETRDALYASLVQEPGWPILVTDVIAFILAAVADGVLIWRCFHVCGHSLRAILVPSFLLFCEIAIVAFNIAIDLTFLITFGVDRLNPSDSQIDLFNRLLAVQAFITFATTLSSTSLIAYRIYTTSKNDIPRSSKRLLHHILEILVQSAAVYSLMAIAQAVSSVIPQTASNAASWDAAEIYTSILFTFISGVAPTVLVARVAMLDEKDAYGSTTVSAPLSGLHFHVRTTRADEESQSQLSEGNSRVERTLEGPQLSNKTLHEKSTLTHV
ncbi:hypothetical protein CVT26_004543 [Gymnopilus dilepis]|uniref:G-protein coupled receptors family 1 profile domain-containing protein n=1 Tax=Gymnopilus dilepis TaxID=231916 RepID=A0A409YJ54_9AGAR|nr:hypothetical protein CVT26_004543 [Gymnopilus dilepis]